MLTKFESSLNYLVERRFPSQGSNHLFQTVQALNERRDYENRGRSLDQSEAYKKELLLKTPAELEKLCNAERLNGILAKNINKPLPGLDRFYDSPFAFADFGHWAKLAYWTLDEAAALSFARNPKVVSWDKLKANRAISQFKNDYSDLMELARRAKAVGQLPALVNPGIYLAWAKRLQIEIPDELISEVEAVGVVIADWQAVCETQKETIDSLSSANTKLIEVIAGKNKIIEHLGDKVEVLQAGGRASVDGGFGTEQTNSFDDWGDSWLRFSNLVKRAIDEFPEWRDSVNKVQKSGNLNEWLVEELGASNREAEIIKKVLSDNNKELQ